MSSRGAWRRGLTLIETLSVIVLLAALTPVLARVLSTTTIAHVDASATRSALTGHLYALRAARVRLEQRLASPAVTITTGNADSITLSDGSAIELDAGALIAVVPGLPDGVLATGVTAFTIGYHDSAGSSLTPGAGLDESGVHRVTLTLTIDGRTHTQAFYREGTRPYPAPPASGLGWVETFDDLTNGIQTDPGETAWSSAFTSPATGSFGVDNGRFAMYVTTPNLAWVEWLSEEIDISDWEHAQLTLTAEGFGTLEDAGPDIDTIDVDLVIDGTTHNVGMLHGRVGAHTFIASDLYSGTAAQIRILLNVTGQSESYHLDDIALLPYVTPDSALPSPHLIAETACAIRDSTIFGAVGSSGTMEVLRSTVGHGLSTNGSDVVSGYDSLALDNADVHNGHARTRVLDTLSASHIHDGQVFTDPAMSDFSAQLDDARAILEAVRTDSSITAVDAVGDTITFSGTRRVNIFSADGTRLSSVDHVVFDIPNHAHVIVLIENRVPTVRAKNFLTNGTIASDILWVLTDSSDIRIEDCTFYGSILAPNAKVDLHRSNFSGSVIAEEIEVNDSTLIISPYTGIIPGAIE